jgi:phosphatidylserine/phosphatidylglycerophosphate/cardiolipin synthase-like enzyme
VPLRIPAPRSLPPDIGSIRTAAEQTFSRTAGAPLVGGNAVRVLRDAAENYPAWEAAIEAATISIHVEMYIFHYDAVGHRYIERLTRKAREGVAVRVIYDWFGCGLSPLRGLFTPLITAGGQVRAFNPPGITSALGWLRRDHRKLITVDGQVAFVSGLCIGRAWEGEPAKKRQPWRDTGIEIIGPAVSHAEAAFADSWYLTGGDPIPLPAHSSEVPAAGDVNLRLIPTEPFTANMLRVDLLVGTVARRSLWLTDAYFIGTGPYLEALTRAARDGVDVRLLLPADSDVGWTVPVSRSLYRPMLEAGVRIFEWNGTMIHAKTAVADSRWARIGSTNLNINSWIGNWELDVAIEDAAVAHTLERHFEEDLAHSTEVVLRTPRRGRRPAAGQPPRRYRSSRRVVRTVTGVGRSLGAAVTGNRPLENYEIRPIVTVALLLTGVAGVGFFSPWLLAWPAALLAAWLALTFLAEAWQVWRRSNR